MDELIALNVYFRFIRNDMNTEDTYNTVITIFGSPPILVKKRYKRYPDKLTTTATDIKRTTCPAVFLLSFNKF